jgi:hypothetical protein
VTDYTRPPEDARERVLKAIRFDGEPCAFEHVARWAGMAEEHVQPTLDVMVADGTLRKEARGYVIEEAA